MEHHYRQKEIKHAEPSCRQSREDTVNKTTHVIRIIKERERTKKRNHIVTRHDVSNACRGKNLVKIFLCLSPNFMKI